MINTTIEDLKKNLGPGLGLRKNRFLIEVPVPGASGQKLNILCTATSLPERTIGTVDIFSKGRKYKIRGETEFPGTYNISIIDDSDMSIRQLFDAWLDLVDQTAPKDNGILGVLGNNAVNLGTTISGIISAANTFKSYFQFDKGLSFVLNTITGTRSAPLYQTEVNIWQLDAVGNKVYGYQLQNAYPSSVGTVELDDGEENTMSEFSVDFSYSEFIPLKVSASERLVDAVLGQDLRTIKAGIKNLFS